MPALGPDVHSYANYNQVITKHLHLELTADFNRKIFYGYVDIDLEAMEDNISEVLLDTKSLAIEAVTERSTNKSLRFTMPQHHEVLGICLRIPISTASKGSTIQLRIHYNTTVNSAGIQWFEPSQTAGKTHPFVYTQCEPILARTVLPCQDTPAVKAPYTVSVTVPAPLVAACSGVPLSDEPTVGRQGELTYKYKQVNPIPSYLIAIVAGALVKAPIGPRSSVWSEKELIDKAVHEFKEHTEMFIVAGEEITGMKYEWGVYDVVVLPSAFPYGGMENPNLTFLSASLLAGDRSLTNVVAHEITHSWAGNYTTNSNWSDFWLNEGFTVYIERMILGKIHNSLKYRDFESLCGYNDLVKTVNDVGATAEFTKLRPNLVDVDPDDAFSKIPYEKGSLFLRYLETKVGGLEPMQRWLKKYFFDYRFKSLSTDEMKAHFLQYFAEIEKVPAASLDSIQWSDFLDNPGLPPFDPTTVFDRTLSEKCVELANKWIKEGGEGSQPADLEGFQAKQTMFFLDTLITKAVPLQHEVLAKLDATYHLTSSPNVEIVFRYLVLSLKSKHNGVLDLVDLFLSKYGRGLYVLPIYRAYIELNYERSQKVYQNNKHFYHLVICNAIEGMLAKAKK